MQHKAKVPLLCFAVLTLCSRGLGTDAEKLSTSNVVSHRGDMTVSHLLVQSAMQIRKTSLDCSHLVHHLFSSVGLPYTYAESHKLYEGVSGFDRVSHPRVGDLIVWRGHVGIVVDPAKRSFISALRTGVKIAQYDSRYWKSKGKPRFFRYALPGGRGPDFWQIENASLQPLRSAPQYTSAD